MRLDVHSIDVLLLPTHDIADVVLGSIIRGMDLGNLSDATRFVDAGPQPSFDSHDAADGKQDGRINGIQGVNLLLRRSGVVGGCLFFVRIFLCESGR